MNLPLQNFSTLLENMSASVQGAAAQLIDLSVGSVLRAVLEATASIALWMQWLIVQVLAMTRAATCSGNDLDSWMADFSMTRLPGSAALGSVTFARYTPGITANIPVGTIVRTSDGSQNFAVLPDPSNPAWTGAMFTLPSTLASITVPVTAMVAGIAGNVQAGAVGLLATALAGVDTVTNTLAFTGGVDAESDTALRARFTLYINSRSAATITAIDYAVASLQLGLRYAVLENLDNMGNPIAGNFCVVVDDGTGAPAESLLTSARTAIEAVRPIGTTYAVSGPTIQPVTVQMTVETSNALTKPSVVSAIEEAITSWVAGLPVAGTLALSRLEAIAHMTDASVLSVTATSMNDAANDITAAANGIIQLVSVTVN